MVPPAVVTKTLAEPAVPAGAVAVIEVEDATVKLVAATPWKDTAVAPVKPVPVIVTLVPPAVGPELGETAVTVGADPPPGVHVPINATKPEPPKFSTTILRVVASLIAMSIEPLE